MPHDPKTRAFPPPDPQAKVTNPSDDTPLDLVAYVHVRLSGVNFPEVARQLGYNNISKGALRLQDLANKPVLGLDEAVGGFDLHYTTIELIDAVCRLDIHDDKLLQTIHDKCLELREFYQLKRNDLAITRLRVVTEYPPIVTSWGGGMVTKAKLSPVCVPFIEGQAPDKWLRLISQQIISHFQQYEAPSHVWGRILGYEYIYRQDDEPIKFDTNGVLIGSQLLVIPRCSTRLGEPVFTESVKLEPLDS